ncbi:MAG: regulatory protein RecX [Candidatus Aquicultor sp.]
MVTVTALEQQVKRPWRTSIFIDGAFWRAYDTETIIEAGLYRGQQLAPSELETLDFSLEKRRAVNRAVLLLSYRARSEHEVSQRLKTAGFDPEIISDAINELRRLGYLNDDDFAQSWTKSRMTSKLYGPKRIKQELKQKGIADEIIAEKLEETASPDKEYELAKKLAETKVPTYKDLDKNASFRRLSQFLLRRGYTPSTVYDVCKDVLKDE